MKTIPVIDCYEALVEFNEVQKNKKGTKPINIIGADYSDYTLVIEQPYLLWKRTYKTPFLSFLVKFVKSSKYYIDSGIDKLIEGDFTQVYLVTHPEESKRNLIVYAHNLLLTGEKRFTLGKFEVEIKSVDEDNLKLSLVGYLGINAHVEIPNIHNILITEIGEEAFNNELITTIVVPDSVEIIGAFAFVHCPILKRVVLPKHLKCLGEGAFACCENLEEIVIPHSLEEIKENTFYNCEKLKRVKLPNKLKKIGESAFAHTQLERIKLPLSLESIDNFAFYDCKKLIKYNIPSNTKYRGVCIFDRVSTDIFSMRRMLLEGVEETLYKLTHKVFKSKVER